MEDVGDRIADMLSEIKDMKTVAYVDDRRDGRRRACCRWPAATSSSRRVRGWAMSARRSAARNGRVHDLSDMVRASLAEQGGVPGPGREAIPRPLPSRWSIPTPRSSRPATPRPAPAGSCCAPGRSRPRPLPDRPDSEGARVGPDGPADDAASYGLGQVVNDSDELKNLYGLRALAIRVDGPGWVDSLVTILTDPYVSWLLLFIGVFMLVVELKLPGIGLPAIISARGLPALLREPLPERHRRPARDHPVPDRPGLPGTGTLRLSGIRRFRHERHPAHALQHRPGQPYVRLADPGLRIPGARPHLAAVDRHARAVGGCTVVLARYFPSLPLFNRLVLKPEPWTTVEAEDSQGRPVADGYESLAFLIGETGRTTSPLRPDRQGAIRQLC